MIVKQHTKLPSLSENAIIRVWKVEVAGCLTALVSLFAILITLFPHASSPLPQWPFRLSINTLLSVYAVIFKLCIASVLSTCIAQLQWTWFSNARPLRDLLGYDEASRSAWGSFLWLVHYRLREPLTALAALLMILSLAIDPFIQQLIVPKDCETSLGQLNATIPRTNSLNYADQFFVPWVLNSLAPSSSGSSLVASSLVCPTGNCTFPTEYSTLAYCSSCLDISDEVSTQIQGSPQTEESYTTTLRGSNGDNIFETVGKFSVANGSTSANMTFLNAKVTFPLSPDNVSFSSSDAEVFLVMGANYFTKRGLDPITGDTMTGCDSNNSSLSWRCRGFGAAKCMLYQCVHTYRASVRAGRLTESLMAQSGPLLGEYSNSEAGLLDTACLSPTQITNVEQQGYSLNASNDQTNATRFISYSPYKNQTATAGLALETNLLANSCLFIGPSVIFRDLATLFSPAIQGSLYTSDTTATRLNTGYYTGASQLLSIFDGGNISFARISDTFASLSDSMTEYVRTNGYANYSAPAVGTVLHYATCLEVRWGWIAFPAALQLCTSALLAAVVASAARARTPLWKASPLAWIYRGPAPDLITDSPPQTAAMKERAKRDVVILDSGQDPRIHTVGSDVEGAANSLLSLASDEERQVSDEVRQVFDGERQVSDGERQVSDEVSLE